MNECICISSYGQMTVNIIKLNNVIMRLIIGNMAIYLLNEDYMQRNTNKYLLYLGTIQL